MVLGGEFCGRLGGWGGVARAGWGAMNRNALWRHAGQVSLLWLGSMAALPLPSSHRAKELNSSFPIFSALLCANHIVVEACTGPLLYTFLQGASLPGHSHRLVPLNARKGQVYTCHSLTLVEGRQVFPCLSGPPPTPAPSGGSQCLVLCSIMVLCPDQHP